MKLDSLKKLFVHELKDLYSAESQMIDAMPKMIEATKSKDLKKAFEGHLATSKTQRDRIVEICDGMAFKPTGHKCKGMEGLIKEGEGLLTADIEQEVLDVALVGAATRVEHYEIAGYTGACEHAKLLGYKDAHKLLCTSLEEEKSTEKQLCQIAKQGLNKAAMEKQTTG